MKWLSWFAESPISGKNVSSRKCHLVATAAVLPWISYRENLNTHEQSMCCGQRIQIDLRRKNQERIQELSSQWNIKAILKASKTSSQQESERESGNPIAKASEMDWPNGLLYNIDFNLLNRYMQTRFAGCLLASLAVHSTNRFMYIEIAAILVFSTPMVMSRHYKHMPFSHARTHKIKSLSHPCLWAVHRFNRYNHYNNHKYINSYD